MIEYSQSSLKFGSWNGISGRESQRRAYGSSVKRGLKVVAWILGILAGIVVAYEAALFVVHDFSWDYSSIDRCFDRGGAWSYSERTCRH